MVDIKTVLVIEDNEDLQELYQIYFEAEGFEFHGTTD
jgi:DNA-binding response OmpR family regulator